MQPRGAGQAVGSGLHWKAKPLAGGLPESRAPLGLGTSHVFRNKATLGIRSSDLSQPPCTKHLLLVRIALSIGVEPSSALMGSVALGW